MTSGKCSKRYRNGPRPTGNSGEEHEKHEHQTSGGPAHPAPDRGADPRPLLLDLAAGRTQAAASLEARPARCVVSGGPGRAWLQPTASTDSERVRAGVARSADPAVH